MYYLLSFLLFWLRNRVPSWRSQTRRVFALLHQTKMMFGCWLHRITTPLPYPEINQSISPSISSSTNQQVNQSINQSRLLHVAKMFGHTFYLIAWWLSLQRPQTKTRFSPFSTFTCGRKARFSLKMDKFLDEKVPGEDTAEKAVAKKKITL